MKEGVSSAILEELLISHLIEMELFENIFNVFSDYIDKPQNVDINYTMNVLMKINDIFSTNLTFQTIYNDNSYSGFQIREVFGLGINVNL